MNGLKKWVALLVFILVAAAGGHWAYRQWQYRQVVVSTDDAYVKGSIYMVASRVPGVLQTVDVRENETVRKGRVIATLDPQDFDAAVASAEARLAQETAGLARSQAAIAQSRALLAVTKSQLHLTELEKARFDTLYQQRTAPRQDYDRAVTAEHVARNQWLAAQKAVEAAVAELEVNRKRVDVAQTALETARLQRTYCTITAPADGVVSRKMAEEGQVMSPGQPICSVVPLALADLWVEANYKETQLKNVHPGQPVEIRADIDDDHPYQGTVESLSAGTGAAFSLLPPENATGNWIKVVQRLPVRIKFAAGADPDHRLRVGLSVTVSIDTRGQ